MKIENKKIAEYLYKSIYVHDFYKKAMNIGFWEDSPENESGKLSSFIELAKIESLEEIDELLQSHERVFLEFLSFILQRNKLRWRATRGLLCGLIILVKFHNSFSVEQMIEMGWDETHAKNVMQAANIFGPKIS